MFKIILDKNGYDHINVEQCLFTFVAIEAKKLCGNNKNIILIIKYISRNDESIKEINKRFIYLSKPINSYCRKNYVNINGIVDNIVKLSQPYFMKEKSRNNKKKKKFFQQK